MRRLIAAVLATLCVLNGSMMLWASPTWYARVPGASETGPYNAHFVEDIGAAFLVSGALPRLNCSLKLDRCLT
jgi:hypothetical protein